MKKFVGPVIALVATILVAAPACNAAPVFVGSYQVDGGIHEGDPGADADPYRWTNNPLCYTPQEAAALLFGGNASDYLISVDPSLDPSTITHTGWEDGWAETPTVFAENFKLQTGTGYNNPGGFGTSWSAYVLDHNADEVNYVWKVNSDDQPGAPVVPEPNSLALLGMGGLPFLGLLRRLI